MGWMEWIMDANSKRRDGTQGGRLNERWAGELYSGGRTTLKGTEEMLQMW